MKTKTVSTKIKDFKSGEQPSAAPAHTPGPWVWSDKGTHSELLQKDTSGEDSILYHAADWKIKESDKCLISLAPEMLEVLGACKPIIIETVEKWSNGEDSYQDILDKINSLLSRASQ